MSDKHRLKLTTKGLEELAFSLSITYVEAERLEAVAARYNISLEEAHQRIAQGLVMNPVSFGEAAASLAGYYKTPDNGEIEQTIFDQGYSPEQAAAIAENLKRELGMQPEVARPLETDGPLIDMIAKLREQSVAKVHSDILKGTLHNFSPEVKMARRAMQIESTYTPQEAEEIHTFSTGAKRAIQSLAYDNIPIEVLNRVAAIGYEGKLRYGEDNWRKGIPTRNLFSHAMEHLRLYFTGNKEEDHLAKACWNVLAIMYMEDHVKQDG